MERVARRAKIQDNVIQKIGGCSLSDRGRGKGEHGDGYRNRRFVVCRTERVHPGTGVETHENLDRQKNTPEWVRGVIEVQTR